MSATPREIGTLIVVVLRANHLPNKRHIGKQDPYCAVTLNGEKRRTKAIKRGGQHPEWDEEIRFTIFEDADDILNRTAKGDDTPPAPPPKDDKTPRKIKGGKTMRLACYADDPREPDLIGECEVDLTEVLTKGESDDWFTLMSKDKFAGKVYLELTFWSNEPPPEKKSKPKVAKTNNQYAGPGSFVAAGDMPSSSSMAHSRQASDVLPSHMRASNSGANLYVAPYERNQFESLTQEFGDFGLSSQTRRRESFPPVPGNYSQTPYYGTGHTASNQYFSHGYENSLSSPANSYQYEQPFNPSGQSTIHFPHSTSGPVQYAPYQQPPTYDVGPTTYQTPARGQRHSIATSSGFIPLPPSSGFLPMGSHASDPSGFNPPVSHTPAPVGYNSQFHTPPQSVYSPPVSQTPVPQPNPYLSHSTSLSFHPQQTLPASQSYNYSSYSIPASASAPPQQFIPSASTQPNYPSPTTPAPPQLYRTSSIQEVTQTPVATQSMYLNGHSSRPLPQQPQMMYTQQPMQQAPIPPSQSLPDPLPPPPAEIHQGNTLYTSNNGFSELPPPPPPLQYHTTPNDVNSTGNFSQVTVPPPPPLPTSNVNGFPRGRRASLPAPPMQYQQSAYQQQPPPPPPQPSEFFSHVPPPPPLPSHDMNSGARNTTFDKGLPKPPVPVNEHGQWVHPANVYSSHGY